MIPTGFTETDTHVNGIKGKYIKSEQNTLGKASTLHRPYVCDFGVSLYSHPPWGKLEPSAQLLHVLLATKHQSASARGRQGRGRKGKPNESEHTDAEARRNTTSLSKRPHVYFFEQYYRCIIYLYSLYLMEV